MGVGKNGMSYGESRSIQDRLEWSPSKTQGSSRIATTGKKKASSKSASAGKSTDAFKGSGGGGGGHNRKGKKY